MNLLLDVMAHPVRLRILQFLTEHESATTGEMLESITGVSKATLYRHVNAMRAAGLLDVVEERRVRGSVERRFALKTDAFSKMEGNIAQTAWDFLLGLYVRFAYYAEREDADPWRDRIGLRTSVKRLADGQMDDLANALRVLVESFPESPEGRLRSLSVVSAPPLAEDEPMA